MGSRAYSGFSSPYSESPRSYQRIGSLADATPPSVSLDHAGRDGAERYSLSGNGCGQGVLPHLELGTGVLLDSGRLPVRSVATQGC